MTSKSKRASENELSELHAELARVLTKAVQHKDETGQPVAALLSVARQFLKDNHIEGQAVPGSPLKELSDLPVFDDDNFAEDAPAH